ncbi:unnamed protein product [Symbiodinium sp. CCMP2592]|nr:unnamed protein product [Symbiodinium sp. CCMP2592]
MSVQPLRTLVRRLRAAAAADDEQLDAAIAAMPAAEALRLYYHFRDHVQQAHMEYETEGSSEYDLPACPVAGALHLPTQDVHTDLLGLVPDLLVPLLPLAGQLLLLLALRLRLLLRLGLLLRWLPPLVLVRALLTKVLALWSMTVALWLWGHLVSLRPTLRLSLSLPHLRTLALTLLLTSLGRLQLGLMPEVPSEPSSEAGDVAPWWSATSVVDLNAMDGMDDGVAPAVPVELLVSEDTAVDDPPLAPPSDPPGLGAGAPAFATPTVAAPPPSLPTAPAASATDPWAGYQGLAVSAGPATGGNHARLRMTGTANCPYVLACDVRAGIPLDPADLQRHGHSLTGWCATACWGDCGHACSRPVSDSARRPHSLLRGLWCALAVCGLRGGLTTCVRSPLVALGRSYFLFQAGLVPVVAGFAHLSLPDLCPGRSLDLVLLGLSRASDSASAPVSVMASVADSAVTFASKARQYGLSQGVRLKAAKDKHLGPGASEGAVAAFSRLLFEAGTFVVAELRSSVASEDDGSKKLTSQERTSRMDALRSKLGAWPITGSFEPSHVPIDAAFGMVADSSVRYLPPSKCSSREQEILSERRDDTLFRLEATALKAAKKPVLPKVDLGNELRLYQALSRRGVALEVAGVCSFAVHENYVRGLLDHLQRMPPPGYSAPGIDAVLAADRAVWQQVAAQVPCLPAVDIVAAKVDAALLAAAGAPAVAFHVMPREKKRALDDPAKPPGKTGKGDGKDNRPGKGKDKGGRGKGGKTPGGGKPGSPAKQTAVPAALKGLDPNKDGTPLRFDRNLAHGCKRETWQTPVGAFGVAEVASSSVDCLLEVLPSGTVPGTPVSSPQSFVPTSAVTVVAAPAVPAAGAAPVATNADTNSPTTISPFNLPAADEPPPAEVCPPDVPAFSSVRDFSSFLPGPSAASHPDVGTARACVAVEIFAGSCRLSKCLKASGFETVAVDVKDAAGHKVLKLDLLSAAGLAVLWEILCSGQVLYVHMAPPCSTASAARFIPGGPRPLRDARHPDGLSGLSFSQRFLVHNANRLYALCRDVATDTAQHWLEH